MSDIKNKHCGAQRLEKADRSEFLSGVYDTDKALVSEHLEQAFLGHEGKIRYRRLDGQVVETTSIPVPDSTGEWRYVVISTQVVSNSSDYRLLVENSPYCIHQIDLAGCLLSMNPAGLKMMGLQCESEIRGMPYLTAVSEEDNERVSSLMAEALNGKASSFEFTALDGLHFASSFIPIWEADRVVSLMGITRDVTEQRQAERALAQSENRLEMALQGANLGLWDWDMKTDQVTFNERGAALASLHAGETPQLSHLIARTHPEDRQAVQRKLRDHLEGRTPNYESEHRVQDGGGWRWVRERGKVVGRGELGQPTRVAGTTVDITERRREEQRRAELEEKLRQAQKMETVGQLAGGLAHDFNNLLLVIFAHLDFATCELQEGRSPDEDLEKVQSAAERAAKLTKKLLTFSLQGPVSKRPIDANSIVKSLLSLLSRVMPESIELALESKDDLPWIEVDPGLVEQALLNLCVNARDAMPEGGKLTVSTRPFSDPEGADWVEISVTDNGSGMCEKVQQKAFEPFFSTKGPQGGTGLGLPMVYGTVHQCGGSVVLTSKPGAGTTVTLAFPACDIVNEDSDVPAHQAEGGSGTILVVEDEDSIRNLVAKVLRKAGYSVLEACDGREGVETFMAEQKVDLVLMDAVMPKMNGRQACERILEIQPKAQILFTSGYHASEVLSQDFLEARGLEILAKPYSPTKLVEVVHTTLSKVRPS